MKLIFLIALFQQTAFSQVLNSYDYFSHLKENECAELEKTELPNMPIKRDQGGLGFCYGFSLTSAIDYFNCKKRKLDCSDPDNAFSSLDVISVGNEGGLIEGGNGLNLINNIMKSGKLATESCAPYSKFKFKSVPDFTSESSTWRHLAGVFLNAKKSDSYGCIKKSEIEQLAFSIEEIEKALTKQTFAEFLSAISIPEACQKNRVPLPPISPCTYDKSKIQNDKETNLNLVATLKSNTPIIFNFCVEENCVTKTGHSILIHGFRNLCCRKDGNISCQKEYKVRDSARVVSDAPGDYWVKEKFVLEKSKIYDKHNYLYDNKGNVPNLSASFLFLCDRQQ